MNIRKVFAALAIVAMLASGVGVAAFMIFGNHTQPAVQQPTPRAALPTPTPSVPTPQELRIAVIVTGLNCDLAGNCVYIYTVEPKYVGLHPLPESPFTVEYEVVGGHQPQPGTFTVEGDTAQIMKDVSVAGPPGAQLTAAVTRVLG